MDQTCWGYLNKLYGSTWHSAVYSMSESTLTASPRLYEIDRVFSSCSTNQWTFTDYSIHQETIDNFKKTAFVVKLDDDVFASWCVCNKLKFKNKSYVFLEQGQITMISFLCKHHIGCNKPYAFDPIAEHSDSLECLNKSNIVWGISTFSIAAKLKGSQNFSKLSCSDSWCKNARLSGAVNITHYLLNQSHKMEAMASIQTIIFIQETCKQITFVLESANTAQHILSAKINSSSNILYFVSIAIDGLIAFLRYTYYKDNKFQIAMLRSFIESFSKFLLILLQHSCKLKPLKCLNTSECTGRTIAELPSKINMLNEQLFRNVFASNKHPLLQKYFTDVFDIKNNVILPLMVLWLIFDHVFELNHIHWRQSVLASPSVYNTEGNKWLLSKLHSDQAQFTSFRAKCKKQKKWIQFLKNFPVYNAYLTMHNKHLRFDNVECQWRKCKNKKIHMKQKFAVNLWKKCKGCKVSRYCSRLCQKLDWNIGAHKIVCSNLLTPPPPEKCSGCSNY